MNAQSQTLNSNAQAVNQAEQGNGYTPKYVVLRRQEVLQRLGVGNSTLNRWTNPASKYFKPDFPKPIYLSDTVKGFLENELNEYLEKIADARLPHPRARAPRKAQ